MNSSCVNAVTGKKGLENARKMAKATDELLRTVSFEFRENENKNHASGAIKRSSLDGCDRLTRHDRVYPLRSILVKRPDSSTLSSSRFTAWKNAANPPRDDVRNLRGAEV